MAASPGGFASPLSSGFATPASPPQQDHHHHTLPHPHLLGHHPGQRLRHFLRPDGRRVHIAATPEEHEQMKRTLSTTEKDTDFDLFIHGSPEHLAVIRELHSHHETRRDTLREQNPTVYNEFEHVKTELDALSSELHMITEHGVALDANFSKFGYSAHLRTKDVDSGSLSSGHDMSNHGSHTWDADKRNTAPVMKFWRRPVVRQYFHKGLLWRSSRSGEVGSFELFADLIYVGIIEIIGDTASENASAIGFLHYLITFIISWKIWSDLTQIINWFEVDDVFQRLCVLIYLLCLLGFTTNLVYAFESTYTSMMAFYVAERFFQGFYFLSVAYLVPTIKGTMIAHSLILFFVSILWIISIQIKWPNQLALIFIALFIDLFGYVIIITLMRLVQRMSGDDGTSRAKVMRRFKQYFEFFPAINIEHRTERTNAFVTLIFGSSVLAILYQNHEASATASAFFGKACLALIQAFAFNWMYFEIDADNTHVHAIRRHWVSSLVWQAGHIPFVMGYTLAAATMSRLVLAHDCANADQESLGEEYAARSQGEISTALRWFYCAGLATALLGMSMISMCHIHKVIPNARLRKRPRLIIRCAIALAILLLPLASHGQLSSICLMGITSTLVVLALTVDVYGVSCQGDQFWRGGFCDAEKKKCRYSAQCPLDKRRRKELERKMKRGDKVLIEDLLKHSPETRSTTSIPDSTTTTANGSQENLRPTRPTPLSHMYSFV